MHDNVDLRRRLALSRNTKQRAPILPSEDQVEFDGSHPVLGVDRQGRFLYLYLPEWMPEDIHVSAGHGLDSNVMGLTAFQLCRTTIMLWLRI